MHLDFVLENLFDILLVIGGLSAFVIYFWQQHNEKRTAATLLIEQIDLVEKNIAALKNEPQLGNIPVYRSNAIIRNNLWEVYKHLLVKKLSPSEMDLVQAFFNNAEQIERAREDIIQTIQNAWLHKSFVEHSIAGSFLQKKLDSDIPNISWGYQQMGANRITVDFSAEQQKSLVFASVYRPMDLVFTPDVAIETLTKQLSVSNKLSGTTAYEKIQKLSYRR